jgi:uncharacterized protein YndB with AHSA1/START domain
MTITHGSFTIERSYPATLARVYAACSDPAAKRAWFGVPDEAGSYELDFRVGGKEHNKGNHAGHEFVYEATIENIVENERIVSTYWMSVDGQFMSVSVASLEFRADGNSTQVTYTEQGAFVDGLDNVEQRHEGTEQLFDALGRALQAG